MLSRAAAMGFVVSLTIAMAGCAQPPKAPEASGYGPALEVARNEGWLQREIRRFRTYPHLDRAYRMIAAGKLEQAKEEFATYLSIDPQDLEVRFRNIVLLHRLNAHAQVILEADTLLRERPRFAPALLYRALASHARSDDGAALRDFRAVAEVQGVELEHQTFALAMIVDLATANGAAEEALAAADRLVALRPSAEHRLRRGRALQKLGRLEEADAVFATALAEARDAAQRLRVRDARAELAEKRQHWGQARQELLAMLETDARNTAVLRRLGEVAFSRSDARESTRWFRATAEASGSAQDRERLANALYAFGDYRAAAREFSELVATASAPNDRHRVLIALGQGYLKLGRLAEAVETFGEAAKLRADLPTLTMLAEALERAGRWAEAVAALEPVADRDASGQTHLKVATLHGTLRRWDPALRHLIAAAAGGGTAQIRGEAYKRQGFIYHAQGQYREAREAFERSIEHSPKDVGVYMALGETCTKLDALDDAVKYLERALALTEQRATP
jgi:tetratricopeptide (TPR) repeat protein